MKKETFVLHHDDDRGHYEFETSKRIDIPRFSTYQFWDEMKDFEAMKKSYGLLGSFEEYKCTVGIAEPALFVVTSGEKTGSHFWASARSPMPLEEYEFLSSLGVEYEDIDYFVSCYLKRWRSSKEETVKCYKKKGYCNWLEWVNGLSEQQFQLYVDRYFSDEAIARSHHENRLKWSNEFVERSLRHFDLEKDDMLPFENGYQLENEYLLVTIQRKIVK